MIRCESCKTPQTSLCTGADCLQFIYIEDENYYLCEICHELEKESKEV
jgi:hypothetical protein